MKPFKFRFFVGPIDVNEVAKRLRERGVDATAGTEHVYGLIEANDVYHARDQINAIVGWNVVPSVVFLWRSVG